MKIDNGHTITHRQAMVLTAVHPNLNGLTHRQAAKFLGISRSAVSQRLKNVYRRLPWIQEDMKRGRAFVAMQRRSIDRPSRFGDMSSIESDGCVETFHGVRIVRKF
jgi:predicted transcriptional regulator